MAKRIMLQGTGSSVGKSLVTAAFCRILNNRGYRVAPFKSQNMALNSFITKEGLEMGRAQVVQAEAARILPHVDMNPILLKPTSDIGSQVILNGRVLENASARAYFELKPKLMPEVLKAFKRLDQNYDIVLIEGAGSPAEINLRSYDIVNMGLAEAVDSDVFLIGDVDKGGVFAALYGTYMLLEPQERKRIKGYIINKFRGDVDLLMPGVDLLSEKIGIPCVGVLPYVGDLAIDDEDSVTERFKSRHFQEEALVKIGVIRLPYLSNFSDFTSLEQMQAVTLFYAASPAELEGCDLIIIPGSKSTIHDMMFLAESGFNEAIYRAHRGGVPILGICGGYQMLGMEICDSDAVESDLSRVNGLGLLPVMTEMAPEKVTVQSQGTITGFFAGFEMVNCAVSGYEIHMGLTCACASKDLKPGIVKPDGTVDGYLNASGSVMGTYFHGIMDNDPFRNGLVQVLAHKKGLEVEAAIAEDYASMKAAAYDHLAMAFEPHLDWIQIEAVLMQSRPLP